MIKNWKLFNESAEYLQIGDRVEYVFKNGYSDKDGGKKVLNGEKGTIRYVSNDRFAVEFDNKIRDGHSCSGFCKPYHGYWIVLDLLIKLEDDEEDRKNKTKVKWYKKGKLIEDPSFIKEVDEYDDFITSNEFRKFLIEKNAYESYLKNYDKERTSKYFNKIPTREYINYAFNWGVTREGIGFWGNLDTVWKKRCLKEESKNYLQDMEILNEEEAKLQGKKAIGLRCKVKDEYEKRYLSAYLNYAEDEFYGTISNYEKGDYEVDLDLNFGHADRLIRPRYYKYKQIEILGPDFKEPKPKIRWWRNGKLLKSEEDIEGDRSL